MSKTKTAEIFLIILIVILLVAITLTLYINSGMGKNIVHVDIEDGTQVVEFKDGFLTPGEKCEYIISLSGNSSKYRVSLKFVEKESCMLKDCVWVSVEAEGEEIYTNLLSSFFERDIIFPKSFSNRKNKIKIVYYLPESAGGETEDAKTDFDIVITAKEWSK